MGVAKTYRVLADKLVGVIALRETKRHMKNEMSYIFEQDPK